MRMHKFAQLRDAFCPVWSARLGVKCTMPFTTLCTFHIP